MLIYRKIGSERVVGQEGAMEKDLRRRVENRSIILVGEGRRKTGAEKDCELKGIICNSNENEFSPLTLAAKLSSTPVQEAGESILNNYYEQ